MDSRTDCPAETTPTDRESPSGDNPALRDADRGAGRPAGASGGEDEGTAGCGPAPAIPPHLVRPPKTPSVVVAPEVAAVIVARRAAGSRLSELTERLHLTPAEVRAVLRPGRMVPVVAEPVVVTGPVGEMVVGAIRASERTARGTRDE